MLFHQHSGREPQECLRVEKRANDFGLAFHLPIEAGQGVGGPDLWPVRSREREKSSSSSFASAEKVFCF